MSTKTELPSTGVKIAGIARHLPSRVVTNQAIIDANRLRLKDAWVRENIGIEERRWCEPGETASTMAAEVCKTLLDAAKRSAEDVSRLLVATVSPDVFTPSTACITQSLFAPGATFACADVVGACGGFLYVLDLGRRCVQTGDALVMCVASEVRSVFLDKQDRRTVMLFGDGAAGVLLAPCAPGETGIIMTETSADGRFWDAVSVPGGATRALSQVPSEGSEPPKTVITMRDAPMVFERAVSEMCALVMRAVERHRLSIADVDFFVFHQASTGILRAVCERLAIPAAKTIVNFDRVGNTTAASVPIALSEAVDHGHVKPNDLVCLVATGGGFTAGVALLRWEA
jgi:3-oxoacyl-[acyl-carrier-protein] synthase-3